MNNYYDNLKKFFDKNRKDYYFLGPCVIESYEHIEFMATSIKRICKTKNVDFVFKASFDKANRTSVNSYRGVSLETALSYFSSLKKETDIKVITDVHDVHQIKYINEHCANVYPAIDVIQIPAFLSRQTDMLIEAAKTPFPILVKKAQFMSPYTDINPIIEKIKYVRGENPNCAICERGTMFGYNYLVNDFKGLYYLIQNIEVPVIMDCTHSVQMPGGKTDEQGRVVSSGWREVIIPLAKAAAALGVNGFFAEVHDNPSVAKSDKDSMLELHRLEEFIDSIEKIKKVI